MTRRKTSETLTAAARGTTLAVLLGSLLLSQRGDARSHGTIQNTNPARQATEWVMPGPAFLKAQAELAQALGDGKPVSVISGIAVCSVGKNTIYINNPMVIESDGRVLIGGPVVDNSEAGFSMRLFDMKNPGAPSQDTPACQLLANPANPSQLPFRTVFDVRLANPGEVHKGGAFTFVDAKSGQQILDPAGNPSDIGLIYTPNK